MHIHRLLSVLTMTFAILVPSVRAERVVLIAGGGNTLAGPAVSCRLHAPFGIDFDRAGNMFIVEMVGGERVLRVDRQAMLTVAAGTGRKGDSGDGGPAVQAQFNGIHSLAVGPGDDLYIADTLNNRVRRIDATSGKILAFAGTGRKGFGGDGGPAAAAEFGNIYCVAFDAGRENLYLADLDNRRIRAVNLKTGLVSTVAGNGESGIPQDGADATRSPLVDPRAATVDSKGSLYILERSGHALRMVDRGGKIRTVAGTGRKGFGGDDGEALKASFSEPKHVCIDRDDNVIIADTDNHVIRKFLAKEKRIIRVAGSGKRGAGGVGGTPDELELDQPHGVYIDKSGALYIADSSNDRVLKIEP